MDAFEAADAFIVLTGVAAYVLHRLHVQRTGRITAHRYGTALPGHRGRGTPGSPVPLVPSVSPGPAMPSVSADRSRGR
ncbi:hypothetical protein M2156_004436 [Streptomyces sp. SAI-149]|nr:hypothetical protein [Streptomyces sp. SAI-119]MDH6498217.1 hypothetical protein [Streptomyces sp. SAI-149]